MRENEIRRKDFDGTTFSRLDTSAFLDVKSFFHLREEEKKSVICFFYANTFSF
jgi:hypothetical protein